MKHLVRINDDTPEGAGILEVLKKFPKETVEFIEEDNLENTISAEELFDELQKEVKKNFTNRD